MTRTGISVALVGPDGAGKSTVAREIVARSGRDARYLYMGVNLEASAVMLPSTRLLLALKRRAGRRPDLVGWPSESEASGPPSPSWRAWVRIGNLMLEEWFRAGLAFYHVKRGKIVVMDRHFLADYWKHDMDPTNPNRSMVSRIHGSVLRRWYPRPDLVISLHLDPEESFRRKPEGTETSRRARHGDYEDLQTLFSDIRVVDASRSIDDVAADCMRAIDTAIGERAGRFPN